MNENRYLYAMNGRVLWVGTRLSQVPVLPELYTAHLFKGQISETSPITDFIIESTHRLVISEMKLSPIIDAATNASVLLCSKKVEAFLNLCENIEISYKLSLPQVFNDEKDNIEMLALSLLDHQIEDMAQQKHLIFFAESFVEKKNELKLRYLDGVKKIRSASSILDLNEVYRLIALTQIHV